VEGKLNTGVAVAVADDPRADSGKDATTRLVPAPIAYTDAAQSSGLVVFTVADEGCEAIGVLEAGGVPRTTAVLVILPAFRSACVAR
jgi:hypothetical protein